MTQQIVTQEARKVKRTNVCCWPGCENETEPGCPLCPSCLEWEREQEANQQAERETCWAAIGR